MGPKRVRKVQPTPPKASTSTSQVAVPAAEDVEMDQKAFTKDELYKLLRSVEDKTTSLGDEERDSFISKMKDSHPDIHSRVYDMDGNVLPPEPEIE